jgi:hypothetical protein
MMVETAKGNVGTMWSAVRTAIQPGTREKLAIASAGRPLSFAEVFGLWRESAYFRAFTIAQLAATPFPAFFWEMPPIRQGQTDLAYEYMAIRSDSLARPRPDAEAFESEFAGLANTVAMFPNLGGDAVLVAPRPIGGPDAYGHIAVFVRSAPVAQRHELFQTLGHAIDRVLRQSGRRLWISTSGLGVPWLHIRLDTVPKYYQHRPYANM